MPVITFTSVLLPEPLGPISAVIGPDEFERNVVDRGEATEAHGHPIDLERAASRRRQMPHRPAAIRAARLCDGAVGVMKRGGSRKARQAARQQDQREGEYAGHRR